jgi:tRNA U38,U39,U40 pseudouridine synthase TruA
MVGAAVQCALGETKIARIHRDLKTPAPDSVLYWAERTAPAAGLFLESVCYSQGEKNSDLRNILRVD